MLHQGSTIDFKRLISVCAYSAVEAGALINQVWSSGDLNKKFKSDDDPVTEADFRAQRHIIGRLRREFGPSLAVVGEEDCEGEEIDEDVPSTYSCLPASLSLPPYLEEVRMESLCLFIDPLDATKEFTKGKLECVMTLIGIALDGSSVAGVMHRPFADESKTVWGIIGAAPALGGLDLTPRPPEHETGDVVALTASHTNTAVAHLMEELAKVDSPPHILRAGGAGYKILLVMSGRADAFLYPCPGTSRWDTCAPEAVLRAAGGHLSNMYGREYAYTPDTERANVEGIIACGSLPLHSKYAKFIAEHFL